MSWKTWTCYDCQGLEHGGCSCTVETGWPEKPSACPMTKTEDCNWRLIKEEENKK